MAIPSRPTTRPPRGSQHHANSIHAQLDQREAQLQAELKKVKAVRTLLPEATDPMAQQTSRPPARR
jgi:hypothetical protein